MGPVYHRTGRLSTVPFPPAVFLQPLQEGGQRGPVLQRDALGELPLEVQVGPVDDPAHLLTPLGEEQAVLAAVNRVLLPAQVAQLLQPPGPPGHAGLVQGEKGHHVLLAGPGMPACVKDDQVHDAHVPVGVEDGAAQGLDPLPVDPKQAGQHGIGHGVSPPDRAEPSMAWASAAACIRAFTRRIRGTASSRVSTSATAWTAATPLVPHSHAMG